MALTQNAQVYVQDINSHPFISQPTSGVAASNEKDSIGALGADILVEVFKVSRAALMFCRGLDCLCAAGCEWIENVLFFYIP